ncbi:MAG: hypothetical protein KJ066_23335 [Acidobacteria bacterium]|nr:hypothetical protein [Acidobacteriota bacterium]
MKKNDVKQRRELGMVLHETFRGTSSMIGEAHGPVEQLRALARGLSGQGPRLQHVEPAATAALLDRTSAAAQEAAAALSILAHEDDPRARVRTAFRLVSGLDDLSQAILTGARSVPAGGDRAPDFRIVAVHAQAGRLAFALQGAADHVRFALGLGALAAPRFEFPRLGDCGCHGTGPSPADATAPGPEDQAGFFTLNEAELTLALYDLEGTLNVAPQFFAALAEVFIAVPVALLVFCPNLCTPAVATLGAPAAGAVAATNNGTSFVPTFDVVWSGCCPCTCCVVLTQNRIVSVTTTHTVGGGAIPNTRPIGTATRLAAATQAAAILAFPGPPPAATRPFAPALVAPACPGC